MRPSFRVRLLRILSPALVTALALLCLLIWIAAYAGFVGRAHAVIEAEIRDVSFVIGGADSIRTANYRWDEPHHLGSEPALDPLFVQVFDPSGRFVWQSPNADRLAGPLPDSLVEPGAPFAGMVPRLTTRLVAGQQIYLESDVISGADGSPIGFVQVSRFVPPERDFLAHLRGYLVVLLVVFSALLMGVVHAATRRVLRPIESIAEFAGEIGPGNLGRRIDLTGSMDRETAILADAMNGLVDRLERSMAAMGEFTANAAHELRTPLSVLHGHVELALRRERSAREYRETLVLLDSRLERLSRMVSALLALGRLDGASQLQTDEDVDLAILLQEAVEQVGPLAERSGVRITVELQGRAWVKGSNELLYQVLINALENAIQYGAGAPVECSVAAEEHAIRVSIRDYGPGIPDSDLERVFERFYRGESVRGDVPRGFGLGLALMRAVAQRHGGECALENADPGLRVVISIPYSSSERSF